jgi:hypothetical protein
MVNYDRRNAANGGSNAQLRENPNFSFGSRNRNPMLVCRGARLECENQRWSTRARYRFTKLLFEEPNRLA